MKRYQWNEWPTSARSFSNLFRKHVYGDSGHVSILRNIARGLTNQRITYTWSQNSTRPSLIPRKANHTHIWKSIIFCIYMANCYESNLKFIFAFSTISWQCDNAYNLFNNTFTLPITLLKKVTCLSLDVWYAHHRYSDIQCQLYIGELFII